MEQIIIATHNANKLFEIRQLLNIDNLFNIISLEDIGLTQDIPETGLTLEENALQKAQFVSKKLRDSNVFADDSGLEVFVLNNAPGVYSARYAGEHKNDKNNIELLLTNLSGLRNRKAQFRTVIALIFNGKKFIFEGIVKGEIVKEPQGVNGFGYDPIFQPLGYSKTFAEMEIKEKNAISHRAEAIKKLENFLRNLDNN